jgi:hypothetical protein
MSNPNKKHANNMQTKLSENINANNTNDNTINDNPQIIEKDIHKKFMDGMLEKYGVTRGELKNWHYGGVR